MKTCPKCGVEYPDTTTLCPADGSALEKTGDSLIGQILIGKYRIDERLSEGGMGTVYRGTHVLMEKTVAIKVLRASLAADEKIVARFSREARAASRISHPNALSVTDFGEDANGVVFLVMEFLSGRTLKQIIRTDGPMQLGRVVEIMRQVGDALQSAHAQGVIHRDLKSENIMLIPTAAGEHAKVLDFGIAKINETGSLDPGLTAPNLVIGTPQYMSPEQCSQSEEIDTRSDIYSFGVILYEALVGHVPFTGDSPTIVMLKHLQDPIPSILEERKDIPPAVERVVAKATAKVPDSRYQTIGELLEDLSIAAGMDVSAGHTAVVKEPSVKPVPPPDDLDETTVVRPRAVQPIPGSTRRAPVTVPIAPPPQPVVARVSNFNPVKILIPSAIALLVVFGLVYFFTRNTESGTNTNTNQTTPGLAADPNSQPVQPSQPPSGKGEEGIPAGGVAPSPSVNANVNANAAVSPSPLEEFSPVVNQNANVNPALPSPTRATTPEDTPPPPAPSATKTPVTKPSPPPNASPSVQPVR
jgi:serine/threonine protein kinase